MRGIPAILLDEDNTVGVRGASSRGICYAQRTLEIFDAPRHLRARAGTRACSGRSAVRFAGDDEVYQFDLPPEPTHSRSCQPAFINIQQFYVEWYLVDRILELGDGRSALA